MTLIEVYFFMHAIRTYTRMIITRYTIENRNKKTVNIITNGNINYFQRRISRVLNFPPRIKKLLNFINNVIQKCGAIKYKVCGGN